MTTGNQGKQSHPVLKYRVPHGSQPRPGWAPDPPMVGIRSPIGLVVGSCTSHPGVLGSIPKREEPGKTGAPCVKVPGSSRVPSFIAHVLHSPPPPPANSFVIGPAVINTTGRHPGGGDRDGMDLGSVTLKRIGFFVFQLNTQHTRSVWAAAHRSVWAAAHSCASRGGAGNVREISRNRHPGLW